MLFLYFDGCGGAAEMKERVFKFPTVIEYYNNNFISLSLSMQQKEGIALKEKYNINSSPAFLFFDSNGNLVHQYVDIMSANQFVAEGKKVVEDQLTSVKAEKMYEGDNRDLDFLIEYNYIAVKANTLDSNIIKSTLKAIKPKDYKEEKILKYLFTIYKYREFVAMDFYSQEFQFLINNYPLLYEHFDSTTVRNNMLGLLNIVEDDIIANKNEAAFRQIFAYMQIFEEKQKVRYTIKHLNYQSYLYAPYMSINFAYKFYKHFGDANKYSAAEKAFEAGIWNDAAYINDLAWSNISNNTKLTKTALNKYIKYALRAIELEDNFSHNLTYAWLLYKTGEEENIEKAKIQFKKTMSLATEANKFNPYYQELESLLKDL